MSLRSVPVREFDHLSTFVTILSCCKPVLASNIPWDTPIRHFFPPFSLFFFAFLFFSFLPIYVLIFGLLCVCVFELSSYSDCLGRY